MNSRKRFTSIPDFNLPVLEFSRELYLNSLGDFEDIAVAVATMGPIAIRCVELAMNILACESLMESEGV